MKRKPRGLKPEEEQLWRKVAETANPIRQAATAPLTKPKAPKTQTASRPNFVPQPFQIGEAAVSALTNVSTGKPKPIRMDRKTFTRMKRGKAAPEARIDLHGMTAAAAQTALTAFLLRAHSDGKRLVLVITGKGREIDDGDPIPRRTGVLRQHLPEWLSRPPLGSLVLEWTSANQRHGGSGAFYIYLSRRR